MRSAGRLWGVVAAMVVASLASAEAMGGHGGGGFHGGGGYHGGGFSGGMARPNLPSWNPGGQHPDALRGGDEYRNRFPDRVPIEQRERLPSVHTYPGFSPGNHPTQEDLGRFLNLPDHTLPMRGPGPVQQPSWARMTPQGMHAVHERLQQAVTTGHSTGERERNWIETHPERADVWKQRADTLRSQWPYYHLHPEWFDHHGWVYHHGPSPWWHRPYWMHHPWSYWWGWSPWRSVNAWFVAWGWGVPIYYDYGPGGNVVYADNRVYVQNQDVCTAEEYAQSAAALAHVAPPDSQEEADNTEWLPLGTFAVSKEDDRQPSQVLQLAVNKEGVISGTLYDVEQKTTQPVQGAVDKATQRVAITLGEGTDLVMETGIYNLTQDQTPVLVHRGTEKTEQYLLVRLEAPKSSETPQDQQPATDQ